MPNRDFYITTESHPELYSSSTIRNKEISEEIRHISEHENAIKVFDDILGSSNSKYVDQLFIRGRQFKIDNFYLSQSYFDLPNRLIRNNSNKRILSSQTIKDIENVYGDLGRYDMSYDEVKQLCRNPWEEDYNYLYVDSLKKDQGRYCICNDT